MNRRRITKLPKSFDVNQLVEEEVIKRNSICPFCGETRVFSWKQFLTMDCFYGIEHMHCETWYGKHDEDEHPLALFRFWEQNFHWKRINFKCHTCGCEWKTEPYPTDLIKRIHQNLIR